MLLHSFSQIVARAFLYASILLVIPSFIAITTPEQYADILLISTIAALAVQFDGGNANNLISAYSNLKEPPSRNFAKHLSSAAIKNTTLWSLCMTVVFLVGWTSLSPTPIDSMNVLYLLLLSIFVALGCSISNTASKSIFALKAAPYSILGIPLGACMTFTLLLTFRILRIPDLIALSLAFFAGYVVVLYATHFHIKALPNEGFTFQTTKLPLNKDQKWIFAAQIISLLLAAKNPILLRNLVGNDSLPVFSVCSALYSIILAPAAAMQIPILVKFNVIKNSAGEHAVQTYAVKIALQVILITLLIACLTSLLYHIFHQQFLGDKLEQLNLSQVSMLCVSALMSGVCIIVASYLMALKKFFLLAKLGAIVLGTDILLLLILSKHCQGITPIYTIFISNVVSMIYLISRLQKK
jgi:hypothetical protein